MIRRMLPAVEYRIPPIYIRLYILTLASLENNDTAVDLYLL